MSTTSAPANPYLYCRHCGTWILQFTDIGVGEGAVGFQPCGHHGQFENACPSWGPVDGCSCDGQHQREIR